METAKNQSDESAKSKHGKKKCQRSAKIAQYALHHALILIFATLFLRTGRTEAKYFL